jgi:hypothetical protein
MYFFISLHGFWHYKSMGDDYLHIAWAPLNGRSGQIRSAWKWYHSLIQQPLFFFILILLFQKDIKVFLPLNTKMPLIPSLFWRTACMETFLPICWRPFIWWNHIPNHLGDPNHPSKLKCLVPAFFRDRFVDHEGGLSIYKSCSEELSDQRHFCKRRLRIFE